MLIHGHPTGNQFFLNAAIAFHELGILEQCYTSFAVCRSNAWSRLARLPGLKEIGRRTYPDELHDYFRFHPHREIIRLFLTRCGLRRWVQSVRAPFSIDQVYWDLDRRMARAIRKHAVKHSTSGLVYAYEDGALFSFQEAKHSGWTTFYDLPIAYWSTAEKLLQEEAVRYPQWIPTLLGEAMPEEKKERKTRELELADYVVCPSEFVRASLPEDRRNSSRVLVNPFGTPIIEPLISRKTEGNNRLQLLFVGGLSQRKGLADLFQAMRLVKSRHVELHVVGEPLMALDFYYGQFPNFTYHSSRTHGSLLRLMQQCDVLVLPSIVEGRAQVQQEAMACGLPIIVTANAGAEDLVEEGVTGYLVPIRSPESIAHAIDRMASCDPETLTMMRQACMEKVRSLTWERYREALKQWVGATYQPLNLKSFIP
jgi:glycosyltransferase involved in cell wall biosynthesis